MTSKVYCNWAAHRELLWGKWDMLHAMNSFEVTIINVGTASILCIDCPHAQPCEWHILNYLLRNKSKHASNCHGIFSQPYFFLGSHVNIDNFVKIFKHQNNVCLVVQCYTPRRPTPLYLFPLERKYIFFTHNRNFRG